MEWEIKVQLAKALDCKKMKLFIVCFIIGVIGYFTKAGGYIWKKI